MKQITRITVLRHLIFCAIAFTARDINAVAMLNGCDNNNNNNNNSNDNNNNSNDNNRYTLDRQQLANVKLLQDTLPHGWHAFCATPIDENVMLLGGGINANDAIIHVLTRNERRIELPIGRLTEVANFDIRTERKTLVYVNAYYAEDTHFSVQAHLRLLQMQRRDLNIVVVDLTRNIRQLYATIRRHVRQHVYFVYRLLLALVTMGGVRPQDITVAGHSVGANIAAGASEAYAHRSIDDDGRQVERIGQLIAIDPALMCRDADILVRPNVSGRVIVVHGEGDVYGVRQPLGTIDIYPNGIGYFPRKRLQPGCETRACSHLYPFILFMEALVEGVMIPAVHCDNWLQFRHNACHYNDTVAIGLRFPPMAAGCYFCLTQPNPPFTLMEHGLKFVKMNRSGG